MKLTASDRTALIRFASESPKGSEERRAILAGLKTAAAMNKATLWKRFEKEYLQLAKDLGKDRYFKEGLADRLGERYGEDPDDLNLSQQDPDDLMEVLKEMLEEALMHPNTLRVREKHTALKEVWDEMDWDLSNTKLGDWVRDRKYKDIEKAVLRVLSSAVS